MRIKYDPPRGPKPIIHRPTDLYDPEDCDSELDDE